MDRILVLLLLALPASGKSEIRRYLEHAVPRLPALPLGPTIQLDDYPYVHLMRVISAEESRLGIPPTFFASTDASFMDARDWLTLVHLINEDYASLGLARAHDPDPAALLERLDQARSAAGIPGSHMGRDGRIAAAIASEAAHLAACIPVVAPSSLAESTVIIEFARGGPDGATLPLPEPYGYRCSLAALSPEILERAGILYVWVTPDESRRRNRERATPGREGDASILHHGVPESVMRNDYGIDDIGWLADTADVPGTITVGVDSHRIDVPFARFDNRVDRTSFLRDDPASWPAQRLAILHDDLAAALGRLAQPI